VGQESVVVLPVKGALKKRTMNVQLKKDKFNDIFSRMLKAHAINLGSPTYFAAVSADLNALIERAGFVAFANNHAIPGKIGAAVVAVRRGGATHAYDTINHMFQRNNSQWLKGDIASCLK
jgi:multimeric flavodoxin WrbA